MLLRLIAGEIDARRMLWLLLSWLRNEWIHSHIYNLHLLQTSDLEDLLHTLSAKLSTDTLVVHKKACFTRGGGQCLTRAFQQCSAGLQSDF